jgi:signal recognition particle subunit SRP54
LAHYLAKKRDYRPALIGCDVYRPAAIDQLETLAQTVGCDFYSDRQEKDVVAIGQRGLEAAKAADANLIIFDTAGRLQIDTDLIDEIKQLKAAVQPDEILLVADAALGQEAVNVAQHFHEAVNVTGIILTKLDGDARGGAALSMKTITDTPIKFMGLGEKIDEFDVFHPDRMASRILGMGDVVSLVEKAQETIDEKEAERMAEKMRKADFNLDDFLKQMQQVKKMGSLGSIVGMLPGASGIEIGDAEEKKMARTEAIILSMTQQERETPRLLKGSRLKRVAHGSGVQVRDVNALLKQFGQMQKMMKMMRGGKGRKMMKAMKAQMDETGGLPSF